MRARIRMEWDVEGTQYEIDQLYSQFFSTGNYISITFPSQTRVVERSIVKSIPFNREPKEEPSGG